MFQTGTMVFTMCLVLAGCSLPAAPTADVMDVQLTGIGLTEQRLAVTLCVTNPNPDALLFRQVTVNLNLADAPLATGVSDAPIQLAPLSSTRVPLTVMTTVRNLGGQLIEVFRARGVGYRVYGSVGLDGALGIRIPYSRSGRLDPVGLLGLASSSADAGLSRCTGSDIAVPL